MKNGTKKPPRTSLILRILGGGYLLYPAWGLSTSIQDNFLFLAAIVIFTVVGIVLVVHSIPKLVHREYFRDDPVSKIDITEDSEKKLQ